MQVKEVMTKDVATVDATATVEEAARMMADFNLGFLPVIHEQVTAGVITDRDLVVRVLAEKKDPQKTTVAQVMSPAQQRPQNDSMDSGTGIATVAETCELAEAAALMDARGIRRAAVHDANYRITGIVSRADLPGAEAAAHSI